MSVFVHYSPNKIIRKAIKKKRAVSILRGGLRMNLMLRDLINTAYSIKKERKMVKR